MSKTKDHIAPLQTSRFGLQQHNVLKFNAYVPAGTPREHLTDRRLWAHIATKLAVYSEIRVVSEDGAYYARLLVTHRNGIDVRLAELEFKELENAGEAEPLVATKDYEIKQRGPVMKWCIIRVADGENVKEGIATRQEAEKELANYLKVIGVA